MKQKTVMTAFFITLTVGTVNTMVNRKQWPSARFLVGTGVVFFTLSAIAEWESEVANSIALAVMTFAILGEGGGIASHLQPRGEFDTAQKPANIQRRDAHSNAVASTPTHVVVPNAVVIPGFSPN